MADPLDPNFTPDPIAVSETTVAVPVPAGMSPAKFFKQLMSGVTPSAAPASPVAPSAPTGPAPSEFANALAAAMAPLVASMQASAPRKKITVGEYMARHARTVSLTRQYFQNGNQMRLEQLHDQEVRLLNQITHSGRYFDRKLEVMVRQEGLEEIVYLSWPCSTADKRNDMGQYFSGGLTGMLKLIVAEQIKEDAEDEPVVVKRQRDRTFGNSKSYHEARTKFDAENA